MGTVRAESAFRGLDPYREVRIYRRNLPHWRQEGATYFVTFRLADSIPRSVIEQWAHDRRIWYEAHDLRDSLTEREWQQAYRRIQQAERDAFERQEARRLFDATDKGYGCCCLRLPAARKIVRDALRFFERDRCLCGDFVIMPNHVHWLVQPIGRHEIESLMQSVKRFSATAVHKRNLHAGAFWQSESHDRIVRNRSELDRVRAYVLNNPAKANLREGEYTLYRAAWLDET